MYSIKPGRGPSFGGGVASLVAAAFGVVWTIMAFSLTKNSPFPVVDWAFPLFGVIFVIFGIAMAVYHFTNATAKKRMSILDVTATGEEPDPLNARFGEPGNQGESTEARLKKIEALKAKGLISEAEFSEQRRRILEEI